MRWDNLFDDLESQLEQELDAEQLDLLAEEERLRLGRLSLRDRITALSRARTGDPGGIRVRLGTGTTLAVHPTTFGKDWLAGDLVGAHGQAPGQAQAQCILPLAAIASLSLTPAQVTASLEPSASPAGNRLVDRIGLPFVLRDLCRRRANIELTTVSSVVHGTIDRVGRDHLDLAVHELGTSRRAVNVTDHRVVPLATIVLVRV